MKIIHRFFQVIAKVPFIPGHEAVGTVVKIGPKATLKIGDRFLILFMSATFDARKVKVSSQGRC